MNEQTQEETRAILERNDVFTGNGEVDQVSMFHISTRHSPILIDCILELFEDDMELVRDLYTAFRGLHNKKEYDAIIGLIRMMCFALEIDIPYVINAIFNSENDNAKGIYLSEFLDDFDNEIFYYDEEEC